MKRFPNITVSPLHPGVRNLLLRLEHGPGLACADAELIYDRRNKVLRMSAGETDVIVKCFRCPGLLSRIGYTFFRPGKAERAYHNSLRLREAGFATAEPLGFAEYAPGLLLASSYFISVPVDGRQLKETVLACDPMAPALLRSYGRLLARMHRLGIAHGDPNISNVFHTAEGEFIFIDTNRASFKRRPLSRRQRVRELKRLTHVPEAMHLILEGYAPADADALHAEVQRAVFRMERYRRLRHRLTGRR